MRRGRHTTQNNARNAHTATVMKLLVRIISIIVIIISAGCVHAAEATPQVPAGTRRRPVDAGNMDAETSTFLPIIIEPRSCSGAFNICRLPREKRAAKREFDRSRGDRRGAFAVLLIFFLTANCNGHDHKTGERIKI